LVGFARLEDQPSGKHQPRVVGVELARRDLLSGSESHAEAALGVVRTQLEFAEDNSGGKKILALSVIRAAVVIGRVRLELGPQILAPVILRRGVPGDGPAQARC